MVVMCFNQRSCQAFYFFICLTNAVNCATALLQGQTGLKVDLNAIVPGMDVTLLHFASCSPELVELFLRYGARTDIRCPAFKEMLPLNMALKNLSKQREFRGWSSKQSIYMMIIVLCFPNLRNRLEAIRLLFKNTKEVEKEIYRYGRRGNLLR